MNAPETPAQMLGCVAALLLSAARNNTPLPPDRLQNCAITIAQCINRVREMQEALDDVAAMDAVRLAAIEAEAARGVIVRFRPRDWHSDAKHGDCGAA
jgi:hypothetical protein